MGMEDDLEAVKSDMIAKMRQAAAEAVNDVPKKSPTEVSESMSPIFELDEDGNKLFSIVVDYLEERGLIEAVDVITVTMLAKSLALYIAVARTVHGVDDIVQVYENGTSNVSGAFTALSKAQDQVLKLSAKLGLSPMDRTRIMGAIVNNETASRKKSDADEIDELT